MAVERSLSSWFLHNPTAANLLMVVFIAGGIVAALTMRQEVFPTMVRDTVLIEAEYRGATASEVEAQVVQPMEQSINTLLDIHTVVSEVQAGGASIFVMLTDGAELQRTQDEIQSAIEGISSLPTDLDPPKVTRARDAGDAMEFAFYGFESRAELHTFARTARARLLALDTVGQVEIEGAGEPEISVWISPETTRLLGLSLSDVADSIQRATFELSGGAIRSTTGEYGLSTGLDRRHAHEFGDIAVVESAAGMPLTLKDVGRIESGFLPHGKRFRINGSMGVLVTVYGTAHATPGEISVTVRALLDEIAAEIPEGGVLIFDDDAKSYDDRVSILLDSAMIGLVLVLILLFLVLEARVALWVAVGLPVALLGGAMLFSLTPYTINFISIFGFVIVIGVVVDDAMVIGESIYAGIESGMAPVAAARSTLDRFSGAITLAIVTNIIAFMPIFFMPGELGLFLLAIPVVTTCVFIVSLIEALWILPAHLAHGRRRDSVVGRERKRLQVLFDKLRDDHFVPFVAMCLANRAWVIVIGLSIAGAVFSWVASGRTPIALQPAFESPQISVMFALDPGASDLQVDDMAAEIERLGLEAVRSLGSDADLLGVHMALGTPASHQGEVFFTLADPEDRAFTTGALAELWRDRIGQPAKLAQLSIDFQQGPGDGRDLTIELAHGDNRISRQAAEELVRDLREVPGVGQISYSGNAFRSEVRFELNATGRALGFDEATISRQLRAQLDGLEAARLTRGTEEVRVMIRGEHEGSRILPELDNLILTSAAGRQAALGDIATIRWERGAVQLRRINGQRIERVEATIDTRVVSVEQVEDLVSDVLLPGLEADFAGLKTWDEAIDTDEDAETASNLLIATVAVMAAIFVLIGGYTGSLRDGSLILLSIPLSAAGALLGYLVLAATFLGVLALGGLVINTALLLRVRYNEGRVSGMDPEAAMLVAVRDRFRPILLSSVTTLVGLAPLIFNNSVHAQAMQPVAISIGFGMLFSIPVILILLPAIVVALESPSNNPAPTAANLQPTA